MAFSGDISAIINALQQSIQSIEDELGPNPSGIYASVRTRLDILEARINNPNAPSPQVENPFFIGNSGVTISTGVGFPTEDRIPGSLYLREDGYSNQGLYAMRPDGYWHQIDTDFTDTPIAGNVTIRSVGAGSTTVNSTDYILSVDTTSGPATINLPAVTISTNRILIIKDAAGTAETNNITIDPNSSELIDGDFDYILINTRESITIYCDGISWYII